MKILSQSPSNSCNNLFYVIFKSIISSKFTIFVSDKGFSISLLDKLISWPCESLINPLSDIKAKSTVIGTF